MLGRMSHPTFPKTKRIDNKTSWKRKGKSCMDHGHMNYTKDKREGGPFGKGKVKGDK